MNEVQQQWRAGFIAGWHEQGIFPTLEPSIPSMPTIPADVRNHGEWAYKEGKHRGTLARLSAQAGIPWENS